MERTLMTAVAAWQKSRVRASFFTEFRGALTETYVLQGLLSHLSRNCAKTHRKGAS